MQLKVDSFGRWGNPAEQILEVVTESTASLIVMGANGHRTASVVIRGGAAESILAAAKEYKPDIIALGSRGLTGIASLLLGSVAERVARYANCSVLIGRAAK